MYLRPGLRSRWMTTFNESAMLVLTARYGKSVRFATRSSRIDRVLVGHHLRGSSKELANALLVGPSPKPLQFPTWPTSSGSQFRGLSWTDITRKLS
jgi:hypothetical protein